MTYSYFPPHLRCLYEELADHPVDEIWEAMNRLGILEEFMDAANETEKDDGVPGLGAPLLPGSFEWWKEAQGREGLK